MADDIQEKKDDAPEVALEGGTYEIIRNRLVTRGRELRERLGGCDASTSKEGVSFTDEKGDDVGQRRQIAAGAHRAFLGNQGNKVVPHELAEPFQKTEPHA